MQNITRVLIAKPGLDGHDRGAKVVARALRDAGFEVIYTGLHQTPEMVVASAVQEDVNIIGLSILSGAHVPLVEAILKLMKKEGFSCPIFVGGIIPEDDAKLLKKKGVAEVFGPGTPLDEIIKRTTYLSGASSVAHRINPGQSNKIKPKKKAVSSPKKKKLPVGKMTSKKTPKKTTKTKVKK